MNALNREASVIVSAIVGLITAVVGLLVAFNIDVSEEQRTAIVTTVTSTAGVIVLLGPIIRSFVYSQKTTQTLVNDAAVTGNTDIGSPPSGK